MACMESLDKEHEASWDKGGPDKAFSGTELWDRGNLVLVILGKEFWDRGHLAWESSDMTRVGPLGMARVGPLGMKEGLALDMELVFPAYVLCFQNP